MSVYILDKENIYFPNPVLAEPNGLLAIGGDLRPGRLILAYSQGIFPWYEEGEPILWWCPHERFIISPGSVHISHSMKKYIRKHDVEVKINGDFREILHKCRSKREEEGTWITDDMEEAYNRLFDMGYAMCAEAFVDGSSAGGLYGVALGRCFFGESMYSDEINGSKLALAGLSEHLKEKGFLMIDCQFETEHLKSMGGFSLTYEEYMDLVRRGMM